MGYYVSMDDPGRPERHINIHFSPDIMAGVYANFANVSHSDYEFTITFARVDHEVEDDEIPGRRGLAHQSERRFMRELIDAMQDNYSKWQTREGIKNLPEYGGGSQDARRALRVADRRADPLGGRRMRGQQRGEPARRLQIGDVLDRDRALE